MDQGQDEGGQVGLEAEIRELLGQIAQVHAQGGTVFSRVALYGLLKQLADASADSPLPGWIAETAAVLGLETADWQSLPHADGEFLDSLLEQSRQVLGTGAPRLALLGFSIGEMVARQDEDSRPALGWMVLGRMSCLLELEDVDAAIATGRQALGLTAPAASSGRLDAAEVKRLQQLWTTADALQTTERYAEAEPLWAQVQAALDALPDSDVVRSNRACVRRNRANNLYRRGAHAAAELLYAEAQALFDALADSDAARRDRAHVRTNRADNLQNLGYHAAAEPYYAEAQALFDALPDSDAVRMNRAIVRINRASALDSLGNHAAAEPYYAEAQALFDALPDSDAVRMNRATVRMNRASNLMSRGDHATAELLHAEAQALFDALPDSDAVRRDRAGVRMNRASNLQGRGAHAAAESFYVEAQALFDALPDSDAVRVNRATVRMNRASNLHGLGAHTDAESYYAEAQVLYDALSDSYEKRRDRASVRMNRAINLRGLGAHDAAESYYAEAQALFDTLPNSDAVRKERALVRMNRASNLQGRGAHAAAESFYVEAQALFDTLPDSDAVHDSRARVRMNRANNLDSLGAHAAAEPLYAEAQALFDALPDSDAVRDSRASVRMNRASNMQNLGAYIAAEPLHAKAQALYDALPDSDAVRRDRARVRMNRAINLDGLGAHAAAEPLHAEAQALYDALPDSDAVRMDRARVRMNRANNLDDLGAHTVAEALHAEAQALYDALPDSDAVRDSRASVRMNRANNLQGHGAHADAELLYAEAQDIFDALPDSDAVRMERTRVRLNRLGNSERARDFPASSRDLWNTLCPELERVRLQSGGEVSSLLRQASQRLVALQAQGVVDTDTCATQLWQLCTWALDWLDLVVEPDNAKDAAVAFSGPHVFQLLAVAESWFAARGEFGTVVALLARYHSRYASAHRLQTALAAAGTEPAAPASHELAEAQAIETLRAAVRATAHRLQALESRPAELRDTAFTSEHQQLLAEREHQANALLERLRAFRDETESQAAAIASFAPARLQAQLGADGTPRALVILLRTSIARPTATDPDARVEHPLALVLSPATADWQSVDLPVTLLSTVAIGRSREPDAAPAGPTAERSAGPVRGTQGGRGDGNAPDGSQLLRAVQVAWALIEPRLGPAGEVHLGVHHTLGELPWSSVADREDLPAGVPLAALECQSARRVNVHLGISLAVQALERGPQPPVAAPDAQRPLGALAHSPEERLVIDFLDYDPIPGVYADLTITEQNVAHHHRLADRTAVLASTAPLLQISCHGEPRSAHTGPDAHWLGTYELLARTTPEAVLLLACSTAKAGENPWGEAGGWGAVLGGQVRLCLGALYPVSDTWTPLYTLLLHRAWGRRQDLKAAMAEVRARLRSGRWGDSEAEIGEIIEQYAQATAHLAAPRPGQRSPSMQMRRSGPKPEWRAALYSDAPDSGLRLLTEAFVVYG